MIAPNTGEWPRYDAYAKDTGLARYTEDLPLPPGGAYGRILLSPFSHARILSIDASKAEALPGVFAVLTGERLGDVLPHREGGEAESGGGRATAGETSRPLLATGKVRFSGEPVAAVAAQSLAIADRAIQLIDVEYEELPAVLDAREAVRPNAPLVHQESERNVVGQYEINDWGDVEKGFQEADRVFEETFATPSIFHHPMENLGTCIAQFQNGELTLTAPIQQIFAARAEICSLFGLEPEQVRINMPYVGGGFGAKELNPAMLCGLWLSRQVNRPVKMVPTAEESFRSDSRHAVIFEAKTGVKLDGTITALEINLLVDAGAYATVSLNTTRMVALASWGPYHILNLKVRGTCVYTNKVPAGLMRGVGKVQAAWGCESNMDTIARHMGIAPLDFRMKNVLHRGDEFVKRAIPLDSDFPDMIRRAAQAIEWDGRSGISIPVETKARSGPHMARGRGMAIALRHGHSGTGRTYAIVTVSHLGIVTIRHNAPEIGGGAYTVLARVASANLGVPQAHIRVADPDSSVAPYFVGVSSQRTTVCMGMAVQNACQNLKQELAEVAATSKGGNPEEWHIEGGRLWHGEEDFSFGHIIQSLRRGGSVTGIGSFTTARADNIYGVQMTHWGASVGAVEVEVDTETGEVKVVKLATAVDVGKAINPSGVRTQAEGGAIMGLGNALFEECVYRDGQFLNGDDMQYRLPSFEDVPEWCTTVMIENGDGPGPMGAKGMAQTSIVVVAPAIANAICDAIGVRVRELPITPERVLRSLATL